MAHLYARRRRFYPLLLTTRLLLLGDGPPRRSVTLLSEGRYFVWFNTPIGEGASEVDLLANGDLTGSDTNFSYTGRWTQAGDRFKAEIRAKRFAPGPPGVFGLDQIDIVVTGFSNTGKIVSGTGFAKQAPALTLNVTFSRMYGD